MRQLRAVWRNFARSFVFFYEDLLLWVGLCLIQGIALLTVVFFPPVFAGLNVVAHRAVEGKHSKFGHFGRAVRTYFWRSYLYFGIWIVVFFIGGLTSIAPR